MESLVAFLVDFVNLLIESIGKIIDVVAMILPDSPFLIINELFEKIPFIAELNWVIPFGTFIYIGTLWGGAIGIYYIVSIALRFLKMIQ